MTVAQRAIIQKVVYAGCGGVTYFTASGAPYDAQPTTIDGLCPMCKAWPV